MKELFLNCRFPQEECHFSKNSIEFFTNVQTTKNGSETRVILNELSKSKFKLNSNILNIEKIEILYQFFKISKGRGYSFRFFDKLDYKVSNGVLSINENNEIFITKRYSYQKYFVDKVITKPIENSVKIVHNGQVLIEKVDFKINYITGEVKFLNEDINILNCNVDCNFDVEVRFESDTFLIERDCFGNYYLENLTLIEVI